VIPVAVKALKPGTYRLITHATGESLDASYEVIIEVSS
jgi:hypothetical protein